MLRSADPVANTAASSSHSASVQRAQHPIYTHWIESGRPHNAICSECRKPNDIMPCATCCRSYHRACLSPVSLSAQSAPFQCPACCSRQWTRSLEGTDDPSTNVSAPRSHPGTPMTHGATKGLRSPAAPIAAPGSTQATPREMQGASAADSFVAPFDAFDPSILTRAREFLRTQGGFPETQDFSPDFLLKLGSMMTELELHRDHAQELVSENAQLRQDNANIRTYLDSNLATGRPVVNSPGGDLSFIRRPSPDTSGKTWDRIVMDLI
ncbi:hypothetical protein BDV19DRAFT_21117 [Aspergillus venezuelensis]